MRAIFVHINCILRDSHIDPAAPGESWRLTPATLEALRRLCGPDQLLIMLDSDPSGAVSLKSGGQMAMQAELIRQLEAGGGKLDAVISCPHSDSFNCLCWGSYPGVFWLPAALLTLDLPASFVLADDVQQIETAYAAGLRVLVILGERRIVDVVGPAPAHKDLPIAPDLTTAAGYITVEQEIAQNLGHPRALLPPVPSQTVLEAQSESLPVLSITSARLAALRNRQLESRLKLRDLARWFSFFIVGAVGVTLGIAYLLTHLYRVQPFPDFVYWITLQFIPRPVRGALFIVLGVGIIYLAVRGFYRSDLITRLTKRMRNIK